MPQGVDVPRGWSGGRVVPMSDARLNQIMRDVSDAAALFESRWTFRALRRVDGELHDLLVEQQALYHEALVTADMRELEVQAAAMIRGWKAVTARMESAGVEDDAYWLGLDSRTGTKVAIGNARQAVARVREMHGEQVIWITPDEVAAMVAGLENIKAVEAVKRMWPTAEVIRLYPGEPAQEDAA